MAEKFSIQAAADDPEDESPEVHETQPRYSDSEVPEITVTGVESEVSKHKAVHYDGTQNVIEGLLSREEVGRASVPLTDGNVDDHHSPDFELFSEEETRPRISSFLFPILNYEGGIEPNTVDGRRLPPQGQAQLGVLLGVYFPCLQNIFGVLIFIRLSWIVGVAGTLQAFCIVALCCCTTLLTAISMSAIATNGKVPGGGSYFMISRSLGPEFGGAVGMLFYLGTTVAAAMYIIGAVEIFLVYMVPSASLFGDVSIPAELFKNTRVYGLLLLLIMMLVVFAGIRVVSKVATLSLGCVLFSIICVFLGVFLSNPGQSPMVCSLGGRLMRKANILGPNNTLLCTKNESGPIYQAYCGNASTEESCAFFKSAPIRLYPAIPGIASGVIKENFLNSHYKKKGQLYPEGDTFEVQIEKSSVADITTGFMLLLAIFFPSVTGIMAGSNRSGDLKNAQYSIPRGTIAAVTTTSTVYLACVVLFSACVDGAVLRDKFGESIGGGLVVAEMTWYLSYVIRIGALLSTIGAGLQSLTGAPRLLQAIAQDGVIPVISIFERSSKRGEPWVAQLLTMSISLLGVLIASVDSITPLITEFFLMCYLFVNLATAMNSLLQEPSWRPRFRAFHWSLSLLGMFLCLTLMFISGWYFALIAMVLAALIYIYIQVKGASKEWGDATRGLRMSAAKKALLSLGEKPPHTKNWRPQILVLVDIDQQSKTVRHTNLFDITYQMKAGRGLTIAATILQGDLAERVSDVAEARQKLADVIRSKKVKGLTEVLVAQDVIQGLCHMLQVAGLGSLRHNCVMMSYPETWKSQQFSNDVDRVEKFLSVLRTVRHNQMAMLVPKGVDRFPNNKKKPVTAPIDIWWIVHDGGLLLLIGHLLKQSRVWAKCKLRLFTVIDKDEMRAKVETTIQTLVYDLRLKLENTVIVMQDSDISAYTYERTVQMQNRTQFLASLNLRTVDRNRNPQAVVDSLQMELRDAETAKPPTAANGNGAGRGSGGDATADVFNAVDEVQPSAVAASGSGSSSEEDLLTPQTEVSQYTFSPVMLNQANMSRILGVAQAPNSPIPSSAGNVREKGGDQVCQHMVRTMHNAVRLNDLIKKHSTDAGLVIMNMPSPSRHRTGDYNFMEYLDALTEGLERVLMVRGSAREVVTIFS